MTSLNSSILFVQNILAVLLFMCNSKSFAEENNIRHVSSSSSIVARLPQYIGPFNN